MNRSKAREENKGEGQAEGAITRGSRVTNKDAGIDEEGGDRGDRMASESMSSGFQKRSVACEVRVLDPEQSYRSRGDRVHFVAAGRAAPSPLRSATASGRADLARLARYSRPTRPQWVHAPVTDSPGFANPSRRHSGATWQPEAGSHIAKIVIPPARGLDLGAVKGLGGSVTLRTAAPRVLTGSRRVARSHLCVCGHGIDRPNIRSIPCRSCPTTTPVMISRSRTTAQQWNFVLSQSLNPTRQSCGAMNRRSSGSAEAACVQKQMPRTRYKTPSSDFFDDPGNESTPMRRG